MKTKKIVDFESKAPFAKRGCFDIEAQKKRYIVHSMSLLNKKCCGVNRFAIIQQFNSILKILRDHGSIKMIDPHCA